MAIYSSTNPNKPKRPVWQWVLIYLVVGAVIYGAIYFIFINFTNKGGYGGAGSTGSTSTTQSQAVATNVVSIKDMAFSPSAITVKKGSTVTWTNQDGAPHNVIETDGRAGANSPTLEQGQSYSFTFSETGTFHYHCSIHGFAGTVEVTN